MKKIGLIAFVVALALVPGVAAQSNTTDSDTTKRQEIQQKVEEKQAEREARLEARNAKKCEMVKAKLDSQYEKSDQLFEVRMAKYQRILDRLNALVLRLENNDLDSSELKEVVSTASELVADMETNYAQYIADLRDAATLSCVDDVDFRDTLQTARSALRTARQDDREIRDFLREEARTVIEAIIETNNGQPVDGEAGEGEDDSNEGETEEVENETNDENENQEETTGEEPVEEVEE